MIGNNNEKPVNEQVPKSCHQQSLSLNVSGWVLVCSTLPADYWKVAGNDGQIITIISFWSNLWKTCVLDSTSVTSCNDFSSLLALDGYIHISRSLLITAVCLGFFGVMSALVGMKCTNIGGSDKTKSKIAFFAGLNFIISGLCSLVGYSVYARNVMLQFFDPSYREIKFELGTALFIGWSGSSLNIMGGLVFCYPLICSTRTRQEKHSYTGTTPLSTSYTRSNYKHNHLRKSTADYSATSLQFGKNAYV